RGAILLEKLDFGYYLSKFAVGPQARGEGIGMELWDVMLETTSQIAWRSRASNGINRWYATRADGQQKIRDASGGDWVVFWKGIALEAIPLAIQYCQNRPDDFETVH
ncbi:MAG: acetylglutamate kinase, partial [Leptospiraceae bacterium]|nr:acetylglutamate kinase [Leptospiraceae bacterium]